MQVKESRLSKEISTRNGEMEKSGRVCSDEASTSNGNQMRSNVPKAEETGIDQRKRKCMESQEPHKSQFPSQNRRQLQNQNNIPQQTRYEALQRQHEQRDRIRTMPQQCAMQQQQQQQQQLLLQQQQLLLQQQQQQQQNQVSNEGLHNQSNHSNVQSQKGLLHQQSQHLGLLDEKGKPNCNGWKMGHTNGQHPSSASAGGTPPAPCVNSSTAAESVMHSGSSCGVFDEDDDYLALGTQGIAELEMQEQQYYMQKAAAEATACAASTMRN
jgi:type II secretory pathway pseudopilin PulG